MARLNQMVESLRAELESARKQAGEEIGQLRIALREREDQLSSLKIEINRTSQSQQQVIRVQYSTSSGIFNCPIQFNLV